jgi:hypothetical protein
MNGAALKRLSNILKVASLYALSNDRSGVTVSRREISKTWYDILMATHQGP